MGKIISTATDILHAVQDVAGRGLIFHSDGNPSTMNVVYVKVPRHKIQRMDDYFKLHSEYTVRFNVSALNLRDHVFLWSTKSVRLVRGQRVEMSTPWWLIRVLDKFLKA